MRKMVKSVVEFDGNVSEESLQLISRYSHIVRIFNVGDASAKYIEKIKSSGCKILLGSGYNSNDSSHLDPTSSHSRIARIVAVLPVCDYIELDANFDLTDQILALVPPAKRIITWRTCQPFADHAISDIGELLSSTIKIMRIDAVLYRVLIHSGITALQLLDRVRQHSSSIDKVVIYAEGEQNLWSRISSVLVGSDYIFNDAVSEGYASIKSMEDQFGISQLPTSVQLFGIAGRHVTRSLSPAIHNAAFRKCDYPGIYLPFPVEDIGSLQQLLVMFDKVGVPISGLTTTSPLKETVNSHYPSSREIVNKARSGNVLRRVQKKWQSDSTDDVGLLEILRRHHIPIAGQRVAITGCGGSGRVAAQVLIELGAEVTVYNRSKWRADLASILLGIEVLPLNKFEPENIDVVVNTIPISSIDSKDLIFCIDNLNANAVIIDYSYGQTPNALITAAKNQRIFAIEGSEMLEMQLAAQFFSLTAMQIPADAIAKHFTRYQAAPMETSHSTTDVDQFVTDGMDSTDSIRGNSMFQYDPQMIPRFV